MFLINKKKYRKKDIIEKSSLNEKLTTKGLIMLERKRLIKSIIPVQVLIFFFNSYTVINFFAYRLGRRNCTCCMMSRRTRPSLRVPGFPMDTTTVSSWNLSRRHVHNFWKNNSKMLKDLKYYQLTQFIFKYTLFIQLL